MTVIKYIIQSILVAFVWLALVYLVVTHETIDLQHCHLAGIDPTMPEKIRTACLKAKNEH
jgi:protein-tyrosine phosphatase